MSRRMSKDKIKVIVQNLVALEKKKKKLEAQIKAFKEILLDNGFKKAELEDGVRVVTIEPNPTETIPLSQLEPLHVEALEDEVSVNLNLIKKVLGTAVVKYYKQEKKHAIKVQHREPYIQIRGLKIK